MRLLIFGLCVLSLASLSMSEHPSSCPTGYTKVDNHCFLFASGEYCYFEGYKLCQLAEGRLVEIISPEEQNRVQKFLDQSTNDVHTHVWMGATQILGDWLFLSPENQFATRRFGSWSADFPKDRDQDNNVPRCSALSREHGWKWVNLDCGKLHSILCEVRLRDDPIVG